MWQFVILVQFSFFADDSLSVICHPVRLVPSFPSSLKCDVFVYAFCALCSETPVLVLDAGGVEEMVLNYCCLFSCSVRNLCFIMLGTRS